MSIETSGLFQGFNLWDVQQSIQLVTAILVELSRDHTPYLGPTSGPLSADQRDTVRDLARRLHNNELPFLTYFTEFMNEVVGLNEGRHFIWPEERIKDAIKVLDTQIAGVDDSEEEGEIREDLDAPRAISNTNFSIGPHLHGRSDNRQPSLVPNQLLGFGKAATYPTRYLPHPKAQTRSYSSPRPFSSDRQPHRSSLKQEFPTPFPPYHRRLSFGSAHEFESHGKIEPSRGAGASKLTSSNGVPRDSSRRRLPGEPITHGHASASHAPETRLRHNISVDATTKSMSCSVDQEKTANLNRGSAGSPARFDDDDVRDLTQGPVTPVTPEAASDELTQQKTPNISISRPRTPAPSANTYQGQQALPTPSVSLRSPFVPYFSTSRHGDSSNTLANYTARTIVKLVDEMPVEKNRTKKRGEVPVEPMGGVDRTPAVVGRREPAKLVVQYETRKMIHNEGTAQLVEGAGAVYRYPHRMDWNSKEQIKKLNAWREQIHRRQFDRKRKTRYYWLESEKTAILEAFEAHLQERALEDKYEPRWKFLANAYNTRHYKRLQRNGSRFVADGRAKGDGLMDQDRLAPWRTANSLLGISKKWPELKLMLATVRADVREKNKEKGITIKPRNANDGYDSDDEEMIDPDQRLPMVTPLSESTVGSVKRRLFDDASLKSESDEEDVGEDFGESFGEGASVTGYTTDRYPHEAHENYDDGPSGLETSAADLEDSVISKSSLIEVSDREACVTAPFIDEEPEKEKAT